MGTFANHRFKAIAASLHPGVAIRSYDVRCQIKDISARFVELSLL
jgi:hypothetical protein